jgi:hypothetical protein
MEVVVVLLEELMQELGTYGKKIEEMGDSL